MCRLPPGGGGLGHPGEPFDSTGTQWFTERLDGGNLVVAFELPVTSELYLILGTRKSPVMLHLRTGHSREKVGPCFSSHQCVPRKAEN